MKYFYRLVLMFFCLPVYQAVAQTSTVAQNNVVPPSPTAAALAKYAEWPVSLYTGTPEINIPLYSLTSQKVTVPVSLSYHASGIKVEEDASWVGLGWSLNCGGVITRTVKGLPDDMPGQGWFNSKNLLTDLSKGYDNNANFETFDEMALGVIDTQPDVFMFNALGRSFKFMIDSNFNIQTIPKSAVKITYPNFTGSGFSDTDQWTVQFEDGTTLYFGGVNAIEKTDNTFVDNYYSGSGFISSWYLKKIVPPAGPEVNFTYQPETIVTQINVSYTDFLREPIVPNRPGESNRSQSIIDGQHLSAIQTTDKLIKFIAHPTTRTDVTGGYALDSIKVYALPSQKLIRQFSLGLIYPTSGRLRLDHITEIATDNSSQINQWSFIYNTTNLPAKDSFSQDHWGYFNGSLNATLLPAVDGFSGVSYTSGDREAHFPSSAAEILTQINYPTGGYSKFTYEANSYIDSTATTSSTRTTAGVTLNTTDPMGTLKSTPVNIAPGQYVLLNYTVTRDPAVTDPLYVDISLKDLSGNVVFSRKRNIDGSLYESIFIAAGSYNLTVTSPEMTNTYCHASLSWYPPAPPQTPVIRTVGGVRVNNIFDFDGVSNVNKRNFIYNNAFCAAPIKNADYIYSFQILDIHPCIPSPDETTVDQVNSYLARSSYTKAAPGSTGGSHIGYGDVTVLYGDGGINGKEEDIFSNSPVDIIQKGFPFPPVTSYDYKRGQLLTQKIFDVSGAPKKITRYNYNYASKYILAAHAVGFILDNPCYDAMSGILVPQRDQITWTSYGTQTEWVQKTSQQIDDYDSLGNIVSTLTNYYYDNPAHMQLTRSVTTKSNGRVITSVSTYPDDYAAGTAFIDDMKTAHEIGIPIEQVNYQYDGIRTSILDGTITRYKTGGMALVDQILKLESANPVPAAVFKYSDRATGDLPYGTLVAAFVPDSLYKQRLIYNQYDNLGNPLMLTPTNAPSTSYQWGYSGQYPVVQASNAKSNDIFYESFEEGNGNTAGGNAKTGHYSYNGSTTAYSRTLSGLDNGTYTLSYWSKTGSVWSLIVTNNITVTGGSYPINLPGQIDDVRFYPSDAQMTTYTYDPLIGLTSSTDAKGEVTYYEYDPFQRLMNIKDKDGNIIKHMDYHYQGQ
jgi:YD repeat-containing protein